MGTMLKRAREHMPRMRGLSLPVTVLRVSYLQWAYKTSNGAPKFFVGEATTMNTLVSLSTTVTGLRLARTS